MARVTVEDCIGKVDTRFELVVMAAQRAKMVYSGSPITVERDNDKNTVVALREIADETISIEALREFTVQSFQREQYRRANLPKVETGDAVSEESEVHEFISEETGKVEVPQLRKDPMMRMPEHGMSFEDDNLEVDD